MALDPNLELAYFLPEHANDVAGITETFLTLAEKIFIRSQPTVTTDERLLAEK